MTNPANTPETRVTEATRVPMSIPTQQLAVPDIPGYYIRWFTTKKIPRALRAGYEWVDPAEVTVENRRVADDLSVDGSSDLGSRVSVLAGGFTENNQPERLYLLKIRQEWRKKDLEARDAISERIASSLRQGITGAENDPERGRRYMKAGQDLFFPKKPKAG